MDIYWGVYIPAHVYMCVGVWVFQVFRCNYLYMKHLDLVSKLNINVGVNRKGRVPVPHPGYHY